MSILTSVQPDLWKEICSGDLADEVEGLWSLSQKPQTIDFNPSCHSPVFYGHYFSLISTDSSFENFSPAIGHPATVGYFIDSIQPEERVQAAQPECNDYDNNTYLQLHVYPTLTLALEKLLEYAKSEGCFDGTQTKRSKRTMRPLDILVEFLYNHNPIHPERVACGFEEIPFVKSFLETHPRKPIPMSELWTCEEAAIKIQSYLRGCKVRRQPEVQELIEWQRQWRAENSINKEVENLWNHMNKKRPS